MALINPTTKLIFNVALILLLFNATVRASSFAQTLQAGQQLMQAGQLTMALEKLQTAYQAVENTHTPTAKAQQAATMAVLGEAYIRTRQYKRAQDWLDKSFKLAQSLSDAQLTSAICMRYGLFYSAQNQAVMATTWYKKALDYAQISSDQALIASTYINLSKYQYKNSPAHLKKAQHAINKLGNKAIKRKLLLALGYQSLQLGLNEEANQIFNEVLLLDPSPRQKSQALGYLARLTMNQAQNERALELIQLAISSDSSADLLIKWEQQQANLWQKLGNKTLAIAAYRRVLMHIKSIRKDIPIIYRNGQSSFRTTLAPVYLGLIDLLLQPTNSNRVEQESNLKEVQQIWEQFKSAELNDYFREVCDVSKTSLNEWQARQSDIAILYPILLPDRLELLLSINQKISRYRVSVTPEQLNKSVDELYKNIQQIKPLTNNQRIYQWLIKPIIEQLQTQHITTLVYIPDGVLRKIPLAVLNDGQNYLIEQFAIVTNPGLSMLTPLNKTRNASNQVLLSGMSKPGSVVEELIANHYYDSETENTSQRGTNKTLTQAQRQLQINAITNALYLPKVDKELDVLASLMHSPVMKNEQFTYENFKKAVLKGKNIIHIASHGFFTGDPETSFIMTYDRLLRMDELTALFRNEAFIETPVELITLSACETAEGDDHAPLGLSGVVVQAGIRSAIGSLWPVDDEAAQKIFAHFYQHYYSNGINKAQALRLAQLALLKLPGFDHPIDWAGFILVGDWN